VGVVFGLIAMANYFIPTRGKNCLNISIISIIRITLFYTEVQ